MSLSMLLTGGTGFVGRQVVRALAAEGVHLRCVVRREAKFSESDTDLLITEDAFAESVDWWVRACKGVDSVIHLAWYAEPGKYLFGSENLACLTGTLALAEGAISAGVRRFIGVGTCFEYDLAQRVLATDTPLKPQTPYSACKAAAYLALSQLLPQAGVSFAWCRLFYLYGEGEDARRLMPFLRARLEAGEAAELTSGQQIRDFLNVKEAGERLARVALSEIEGPINICSGEPITVRQMAERIANEYGRCDLLKFGARHDNPVDPECVLGIPTRIPHPPKGQNHE